MHIISQSEHGEADKMVIFGGYNRQILLYFKNEFSVTECELEEEYGGCRLQLMTPTTAFGKCEGCGKTIHLDCDRLKNVSKEQNCIYKCPACKDIDHKTGKKRPQKKGGKSRGR